MDNTAGNLLYMNLYENNKKNLFNEVVTSAEQERVFKQYNSAIYSKKQEIAFGTHVPMVTHDDDDDMTTPTDRTKEGTHIFLGIPNLFGFFPM